VFESEVTNLNEDSDFVCLRGSVRISAYTNQSRASHSVRMRENGADVYPKQASLERCCKLLREWLLEECTLVASNTWLQLQA